MDVSKEKSTVCILKPYGEIISKPFEMKEYRCQGLRRVKTDKQDTITISDYGIDQWYRLKNYEADTGIYEELKLLGRQYRHYMRMRIESVLKLTHLLDYTMTGIKALLKEWNETNGKDKLSDFTEEYWHYDNITKKSEKQFINNYLKWAKKRDTIRTRIKLQSAGTGGCKGVTRSLPCILRKNQIY